MARFKFTYKDSVTPYLNAMDKRMSPNGRIRMNTDIIARVIHAAITYNFQQQGRPNWADLSFVYKKIKATSSSYPRFMNQQPAELGKYPTPWGKIGTRFGMLFNTLGTILNITPNLVRYGTIAPYASQFAQGHTVNSIKVNYVRNGKTISYTKAVNVHVQGRPFDYMSDDERQAISTALMDYVTAPKEQQTILIPNINHPILAPGGRRVYIFNH